VPPTVLQKTTVVVVLPVGPLIVDDVAIVVGVFVEGPPNEIMVVVVTPDLAVVPVVEGTNVPTLRTEVVDGPDTLVVVAPGSAEVVDCVGLPTRVVDVEVDVEVVLWPGSVGPATVDVVATVEVETGVPGVVVEVVVVADPVADPMVEVVNGVLAIAEGHAS
jgi:hypothetical protein